MSDSFNPYSQWLGLPEGSPPTNHYELLGIAAGETDPAVISHAADTLISRVRSIRPGTRVAQWQGLLDQLIKAKACMTDPAKRAAHDSALETHPTEIDTPTAPPAPLDTPDTPTSPPASPSSPWHSPWQEPPAEKTPPQPPASQAIPQPIAGQMLPQAGVAPQSIPQAGTPVQPIAQPSDASHPLPRAAIPSPRSSKSGRGTMAVLASRVFMLLLLGTVGVLGYLLFQKQPASNDTSNSPVASDTNDSATPGNVDSSDVDGISHGGSPGETSSPNGSSGGNGADSQTDRTVDAMAGTSDQSDPPGQVDRTVQPDALSSDPGANTTLIGDGSSTSPDDPALTQGLDKSGESSSNESSSNDGEPNPEKTNEPIKPEAFAKAIADARTSLSEHDTSAARRHLQVARISAQTQPQRVEVDRVDIIAGHLDEFWRGMGLAVDALGPAEPVKVGNTYVAVVESSPEHLIVKAAGRLREFSIRQIPPVLVKAVADLRLGKDQESQALLGVYLAVDPEGDRPRARKLWQWASEKGVDVSDMVAELDALEGVARAGGGGGSSGQGAAAPSAEALTEASEQVRGQFGAEYKEADNAYAKGKLAVRLLDTAVEEGIAPDLRYALLTESITHAQAAGDVETAFAAIDELARSHAVDARAMKLDALTETAKNAKGMTANRKLVAVVFPFLEEAMTAGDVEQATHLCTIAESAAKAAQNRIALEALFHPNGIRQRIEAMGKKR